jgi:hypothetical protein
MELLSSFNPGILIPRRPLARHQALQQGNLQRRRGLAVETAVEAVVSALERALE